MTEALPLSASAVAEWIPFAKAAGFFLATFVLEDLAAVGAGLLVATGGISWPAAFAACFLGIWMGDAGLYALGRYAGRGWFERSSLRRFAAKVPESERWFGERGTPILIFSRLIPGARLPTYLAAGFLRVPLPRFLLITGVASCVWTVAILFLAQTFGERLTNWLGTYKHAGLLPLGVGVLLFATLQLLRRAFVNFNFHRFTARLNRWRHLQSHDSTHDADKCVVMHGMCDGIHDFTSDGGWRNLRTVRRVAGFARDSQRTQQEDRVKTFKTLAEFTRGVRRGEAVGFN